MNLCILTYKYPGKHNTSDYAFVKQLVDAIAEKGHHCYVLVPFNITYYKRLTIAGEDYKQGKGRVTVIRPGYLSFSTLHIGKFKLSSWLRKRALKKAFKEMGIIPDAIYGHFWSSGYAGYEFAKKHNVPLFVASGESDIKKLFKPKGNIDGFTDFVKGVICVSSKNRDESIKLGLTSADKCGIYPNAVNSDLFKKYDKAECRAKLGFPQDAFIVAFVGWFIERKGPLRVAEATSKVGGVNSLFIGKGQQEPMCDGILFKGALPHEEIPIYLGAADCFVLPTLAEGCCNAIVEAMACGLPVISSNLPFNWDVLDESNGIMVDPNNVDEIAAAIRTLRDDKEKLTGLSRGALKKAASLTIDKRAGNIMSFIHDRILNQ